MRLTKHLFIADETIIVQNTNDEVSLIGSGTGRAMIPALNMKKGACIFTQAEGVVSRDGNPIMEFKLKLGEVLIASTRPLHATLVLLDHWDIKFTSVIRSEGVNGKIHTVGRYSNTKGEHVGLVDMGEVTLDTTVDQVLDLTFKWGPSRAALILKSQLLLISMINI